MAPRRYRKKGGKYAQLRVARGEVPDPEAEDRRHDMLGKLDDDAEVSVLITAWCMLEISLANLQRIGAAAIEAGYGRPAMEALSALGSSGQYVGNMYRDMLAMIGRKFCKLPRPTLIRTIVYDRTKRPAIYREILFPVLLPHLWLWSLCTHHPWEFEHHILGAAGVLEAFWASQDMTHDDRWRRHPVKLVADYAARAIVLKLHGDGVPYGKKDLHSIDAVSMLSCFGIGEAIDLVFLLMAVPQVIKGTLADGRNTTSNLWRVIMWSIQVCLVAKFPPKDANGEDYVEGTWEFSMIGEPLMRFRGKDYVACFGFLEFDMEYGSNSLGLRHWQSESPCSLCTCDRDHGEYWPGTAKKRIPNCQDAPRDASRSFSRSSESSFSRVPWCGEISRKRDQVSSSKLL